MVRVLILAAFDMTQGYEEYLRSTVQTSILAHAKDSTRNYLATVLYTMLL